MYWSTENWINVILPKLRIEVIVKISLQILNHSVNLIIYFPNKKKLYKIGLISLTVTSRWA